MAVSRRFLLQRIGAAGGYGAAYAAMQALGLTPAIAAAAEPVALPVTLGSGRHVIVLGAGIAGLVTAYELERAGFKVTVLEARDRVGGRNWTLRGGDKVEMVGEETQTVGFSKGIYMNAGPARIPSHHQGLIGYCKRLGVPLEVEINSSRSAHIWSAGSNGGKPIQMRQGVNDTRGYIAELLAKAINQGALDAALTAEDREKLLPFLRAYGDLDETMTFKGTERSGYDALPGAADQIGHHRPPLPFRELLANEHLGMTLFEDNIDMQATMFQPVGGMDRIPAGFERAIRSPILRGAEVTKIASQSGAAVTYRDRRTGALKQITGDQLVITIPLALLAEIDTDFAPDVKAAIASVPNDHSNKIGFEAPRFWERQQIYGGISFVGGETNLIWYPSADLHSDRGMLLACYGSGPPAATAAARPLADQIAMAKKMVGTVHPGDEASLSHPVVINWSKIPFNMGPWPRWRASSWPERANDLPAYALLNQPHGAVHFTGAHLSQMPGWQEGAVMSAHRTIAAIAGRTREAALTQTARETA
jgi:monoamine oxidase